MHTKKIHSCKTHKLVPQYANPKTFYDLSKHFMCGQDELRGRSMGVYSDPTPQMWQNLYRTGLKWKIFRVHVGKYLRAN